MVEEKWAEPCSQSKAFGWYSSALDSYQTHVLGEKWREFRPQDRKILDDNLRTLDLYPWPQKDLNGDCPELGCTVPPHTSEGTRS